MKTLASIALFSSLLIGCVGDNEPPPTNDVQEEPAQLPIPFPRTCAQAKIGHKVVRDGEHELYVGNDANRVWSAYCVDMDSSSPKEYLSLSSFTYSEYQDSLGNSVRTEFDKVRIDPVTLRLDMADQTFSVTAGTAVHPTKGTVSSMPLGVAMACGGGTATAQISLEGSMFTIEDNWFVLGVAANGHASRWQTNQTIEMWAGGDCGWIAPNGAPQDPMNGDGSFVIQLTMQ